MSPQRLRLEQHRSRFDSYELKSRDSVESKTYGWSTYYVQPLDA